MGSGHGHAHFDDEGARFDVRFFVFVGLLLAGVGLFLWISSQVFQPTFRLQTSVGETVRADVVRVVSENPETLTQVLELEYREGPRTGQRGMGAHQVVSFEEQTGVLRAGDAIYVLEDPLRPPGEPAFVVDVVRTGWLAVLALVVAVATLATARWQGIGALIGLAVTFGVLAIFVVPAILSGANPVISAIVGAMVILLVTLYTAHGFNGKATTALLGTVAGLLVTGGLAVLATGMTRLTGLASDDAAFLYAQSGGTISLAGLLLAGIIIGAIGVLNDSAITQASAIYELRRTLPGASWQDLYGRGMRVGRDHIASSIYTLVLAYAGAALPLFLLVALSTDPLLLTANREFIAEELVRTMVGTLGLLACVPITTLMAAWWAAATDPAGRGTGGGEGRGGGGGQVVYEPARAPAAEVPDVRPLRPRPPLDP